MLMVAGKNTEFQTSFIVMAERDFYKILSVGCSFLIRNYSKAKVNFRPEKILSGSYNDYECS